MTREERTKLIKHLQYNRSIGADYLITDKDVDEIIKALEQQSIRRIEYGTDGNAYKMSISNGKEFEPCEDCISRQAMFEIQAKYAEHIGATKFWQMRDEIKALPSIAPQQKTGHWIDTGSGQECSECGEIQYGYDNFRFYCAKCGSKNVIESEE